MFRVASGISNDKFINISQALYFYPRELLIAHRPARRLKSAHSRGGSGSPSNIWFFWLTWVCPPNVISIGLRAQPFLHTHPCG